MKRTFPAIKGLHEVPGFRIGIETALLTSTGLIVVVATLDQEILQGQVVQVAFLYVLMAVAFAQARRVLVEERARSAALVEASEITDARLRRLEGAHSALSSLSELASSADLNPVSVGEAALRDLALLVPQSVSWRMVARTLSEAGGKWLENQELFDIYRGEGIPADMASFAVRLTFRSREGTLTDKQVDKQMKRILDRLNSSLQVTLRS